MEKEANIFILDGKILNLIRKITGYSQKELGEKIGVASDIISKHERGITDIDAERSAKIIDALGVDIKTLKKLTAIVELIRYKSRIKSLK